MSITGLVPPITAATTITTTDSAGQTIAVAVAAGAGIVGAGALAAWLFKPVAGAPPAPTSPPPYSTSKQDPPKTEDPPKTTDQPETSEPAPACPFPTKGPGKPFKGAPDQPKWTVDIPAQTTSALPAKCTQQGDNKQLLRGTDPGYVKSLASVFCKSDLSKDQSKTIGQNDLPDGDSWKNSKLDGIKVKFDFKFALKNDGCAKNCVDAYSYMLSMCKYILSLGDTIISR